MPVPLERPLTPPLDQLFAALADPVRVAVVELLQTQPRRASDLASLLQLTRPTMSRHLKFLRQAGLVEEEIQRDDARVRVYHLRVEPLLALRKWSETMTAFWEGQLQAFKDHAETQVNRPSGVVK